MKYSLLVFAHPDETGRTRHAWEFASAVTERGHQLYRVFFYGDGVLNARETGDTGWQQLAAAHGVELVLCSASAERHALEHPPEPYLLMGLGALMEAGLDCERVVSFG